MFRTINIIQLAGTIKWRWLRAMFFQIIILKFCIELNVVR